MYAELDVFNLNESKRKKVNYFICFLEIVSLTFLSIMFLPLRLFSFINKVDKPLWYSVDFYLFRDVLEHRLKKILFRNKDFENFFITKRGDIDDYVNQSGKKNSRRNRYIRNEFKKYVKLVKSDEYEVVLTSFLGLEIEKRECEKDLIKKNIVIRNGNELIINNTITRNAIIEYEFFNNHEGYLVDLIWTVKAERFFKGKYPGRFDNMKRVDYSRIIFFIQNHGECAKKEKRLTTFKTYNKQAQEIATFLNNTKALKDIEDRFEKLELLEI